MKAISMWQPWASWVAWGWKTIETREHSRFACLVNQRIAIHAAKRLDRRALREAAPFLCGSQVFQMVEQKDSLPYGAIICCAFVTEHRLLTLNEAPCALIECATPRFGLFLTDVVPLDKPVSARGFQGIFDWPSRA
jgi:hypothetical protein